MEVEMIMIMMTVEWISGEEWTSDDVFNARDLLEKKSIFYFQILFWAF